MNIEEQGREKAAPQHGLITRAQALALGYSRSAIDRRLRSGGWVKFAAHVYRLAGTPQSQLQRVLGACLTLGPRALASHSTAAYLWGLDGSRSNWPAPLEFSAPRSARCELPGVVLHNPRDLKTAGRARRLGVPTTHLARTLVDLAATLDAQRLERALDCAWRQKPGLPRWLERYLADLGCRGRTGVHTLLAFARSRRERPTDSAHELEVLKKIREARLPAPTLQHQIFDELGFVARVDFAWIPQRVVLFADGWGHHHSRESFDHDHEQRERLAACGWTSVEVSPRLVEGGSWLRALARHLCHRELGPDGGKRAAGTH